jgi:hypothetical protein
MSKERELLEQISRGQTSWKPIDDAPNALETFQHEAERLKATLQNLHADDLIDGYDEHRESRTSHGYIDLVYVKGGLTLKGQDTSQWPE